MNKRLIAKSFNQAAASYNQAADLQFQVGTYLINELRGLPNRFKVIADVGAGTGLLTHNLLNFNPNAQYFLVDMAYLLLRTSPVANNVTPLCADFDNLPFQVNSLDCIFASMSLQWSLNFKKTLCESSRCLKKDGILAIAIPVVGTLSELEETHRVNRFMSTEQVQSVVNSLNFKTVFSHQKVYKKSFVNHFGFVRYLKKTGASCPLQTQLIPRKKLLTQSRVNTKFQIYFLILEK